MLVTSLGVVISAHLRLNATYNSYISTHSYTDSDYSSLSTQNTNLQNQMNDLKSALARAICTYGSAAAIFNLINVIGWSSSYTDLETLYSGISLGQVTLSRFQTALDDNLNPDSVFSQRWESILYWYCVLYNNFGITNQTTIEWALNNATMMSNGLPDSITTTSGVGSEPSGGLQAWSLYDRYDIWGYMWANQWNYETSKWNYTQAFHTFNSSIYTLGEPCDMITNTSVACSEVRYGPRYYDEASETIDAYLEFNATNLENDVNDAVHWWNWMNQNLWNSTVGAFNYALNWAGYECESGGMEEIIWKLYYYDSTLGNITRMFSDISTRFLAEEWDSPQWGVTYNDTCFVVDHMFEFTNQQRLENTIMAWAAILGVYNQLPLANQIETQDMLNGSSYNGQNLPAWALLFDSTLYNATTGKFMWQNTAPDSLSATAAAADLILVQSVSPITGSLAIPIADYRYEYYDNIIDSGMWRIDFTTHSILLPVSTAGSFYFMFGSTPLIDNLNSAGLWNITFSSDWNSIVSTSVSDIPASRIILGTAVPSTVYLTIQSSTGGYITYSNGTTISAGTYPYPYDALVTFDEVSDVNFTFNIWEYNGDGIDANQSSMSWHIIYNVTLQGVWISTNPT